MKNMSHILLAGLIAGWFATTASTAPQDALATGAATETKTAPRPNAVLGADEGLLLNLRGVTVDQALAFLSEKAGFTIIRQASTSVLGNVDVVSDTPLSQDRNPSPLQQGPRQPRLDGYSR